MRTFAFILLVAFACTCYGDTSKPQAPITKKERAAIETVIKKETTEKILAITRKEAEAKTTQTA